jgi:hypothetical protein
MYTLANHLGFEKGGGAVGALAAAATVDWWLRRQGLCFLFFAHRVQISGEKAVVAHKATLLKSPILI